MRILIFGINFKPELTGIGKYTGEMAEWFANNDNEVVVITAMPYYPEWKKHKNYNGKLWHTEKINNLTIKRVPIYIPRKVNSIKRIIHEFSFFFSSIIYWLPLFFSKKYDILFSISPPFHIGIIPLVYKKMRNCLLINHIQDLQIDAAKELGMLKSNIFLKIMFNIEQYIMKKSDYVSTISEGMTKKILLKNIPKEKLIFFPNWVDGDIIFPVNKKDSLINEFGFSIEDKIILYSGNLGEKQGLEIIIRIAEKFKNDTQLKFVICGSGGAKEKLLKQSKEVNLKNIFFFPLQPYEKLSMLLASADIHLVLQKASAADLVMPSKLTGILAAGGCSIVTAKPETTLYNVITKYNIGIIAEPENDLSLENAIKKCLTIDTSSIKTNARNYAEKYLDKNEILSELNNFLLSQLN